MLKHSSDSAEQRALEPKILRAFEAAELVTFTAPPVSLKGLRLDGYAAAAMPVLVEVFAHVGPSKGGQRHKISHDMTRMLLAERLLGVACRKVVAVIDAKTVAHFKRGWDGRFAEAFGIEVFVVPGFEDQHVTLREVQRRQSMVPQARDRT